MVWGGELAEAIWNRPRDREQNGISPETQMWLLEAEITREILEVLAEGTVGDYSCCSTWERKQTPFKTVQGEVERENSHWMMSLGLWREGKNQNRNVRVRRAQIKYRKGLRVKKIHIYMEKDLGKRKAFWLSGIEHLEKAYGTWEILASSLPRRCRPCS